MKNKQFHILVIGLIFILILSECKKDTGIFIPEFRITLDKEEGLTTEIFAFSVSSQIQIPPNEKLYSRWDWDGDSFFDTNFSDNMNVNHRFHEPGKFVVVCEVLNLSGETATDTINVNIAQGFSSPKPEFAVIPETSHFRTEFFFDASQTIDDEDSLSTLQFRWDFDSDGSWDTPFSSAPTVLHRFDKPNEYKVNLEVLDPTKRYGKSSRTVIVHRTDTCIVPGFTWWSENGRVSDIFVFNASSSYHQIDQNKTLLFKWQFLNQAYTESTIDPIIEFQFRSPGLKKVVLLVEDEDGLQNKIEQEFFVAIENTPPKPFINTGSPYGNIETQFYMNTWGSRDDHTSTSKLLYRWDFDGDGIWDTNQSSEIEIFHQYATPGKYTCILEAEDEEGLTGTTSFMFEVSPYNYPTGFIRDKRDDKYYGTVKIGDDWWMSENLDYRMQSKMGLPNVQKCYNNDPNNCEKYGSLYALEFVMSYMDLDDDDICPESWHIPTQIEMERLISNIEQPNGMHNLRPNGSSGFNALFGGYITYERIKEDHGYIYQYSHSGIDFSTYFLTTQVYPNRVFPKVYTLNIQANYAELYPIEANMMGYYSIRCIKD